MEIGGVKWIVHVDDLGAQYTHVRLWRADDKPWRSLIEQAKAYAVRQQVRLVCVERLLEPDGRWLVRALLFKGETS
jgi:hypothetical protein